MARVIYLLLMMKNVPSSVIKREHVRSYSLIIITDIYDSMSVKCEAINCSCFDFQNFQCPQTVPTYQFFIIANHKCIQSKVSAQFLKID